MAIIKQPFPKVVQKGKQLNKEGEEIIVKLITSPNYNFQLISKMNVHLISSIEPKNRSKKKQIENDLQSVDPISKITKWNLKFLNGTRKSFVQLKFSLPISIFDNNLNNNLNNNFNNLNNNLNNNNEFNEFNNKNKNIKNKNNNLNINNNNNNNNNKIITVESPQTNVFIINTSDCQWEDSMGLLLRSQIFIEPVCFFISFFNFNYY